MKTEEAIRLIVREKFKNLSEEELKKLIKALKVALSK